MSQEMQVARKIKTSDSSLELPERTVAQLTDRFQTSDLPNCNTFMFTISVLCDDLLK